MCGLTPEEIEAFQRREQEIQAYHERLEATLKSLIHHHCETYGYGCIMQMVSKWWREKEISVHGRDGSGAHVVCVDPSVHL